jgi:hypothetical protein
MHQQFGAVCGNDNVLAKSKYVMVVIMCSGGTSTNWNQIYTDLQPRIPDPLRQICTEVICMILKQAVMEVIPFQIGLPKEKSKKEIS